MKKSTLILVLVLYWASAGLSYVGFTYLGQMTAGSSAAGDQVAEEVVDESVRLLEIKPSEPKDQVCPLNGKMYTASEKAAWELKRPLFVMIENTPDARPQSGLSQADVVFEAVAESGITRFGAMFYCGVQVADTTLAPIRSARVYYMDYARGFNDPLYTHVGGANLPGRSDALGTISDWGWSLRNDLNQFSIGYPTFVRNGNRLEGKEIATEHTMETTTEKLWAVGTKRGWTNMSPEIKSGKKVIPGTDWKDGYKGWTFEDGQSAGSVAKINYDFWSGYDTYAVEWNYDSATNSYKRSQGGEAHMDLNNGQQISANNVVVLLTTEEGPINEKQHMLYTTTGTGEALLFKNGEAKKVTWSKKDTKSELQFLEKGQPVTLNRGMVWISVVNKKNTIAY